MATVLVVSEEIDGIFNEFINKLNSVPEYPKVVVTLVEGIKDTVMGYVNEMPEANIDGLMSDQLLNRMIERFEIVDGVIKVKTK